MIHTIFLPLFIFITVFIILYLPLKSYNLFLHDECYYIINAINALEGQIPLLDYHSVQPLKDYWLAFFFKDGNLQFC